MRTAMMKERIYARVRLRLIGKRFIWLYPFHAVRLNKTPSSGPETISVVQSIRYNIMSYAIPVKMVASSNKTAKRKLLTNSSGLFNPKR